MFGFFVFLTASFVFFSGATENLHDTQQVNTFNKVTH